MGDGNGWWEPACAVSLSDARAVSSASNIFTPSASASSSMDRALNALGEWMDDEATVMN